MATTARSLLGLGPSGASTSDSVLVIIDAQNEYAKGKLAVRNLEPSRAAIASLLRKYRDASAPVVHVVHVVPEGAPIFTPGTELATEFDELKPADGESVVTKQFPGSFTGTNLENLLKDTKRSKIVLTGYMVSLNALPLFPVTTSAKLIRLLLLLGPRLCLNYRSPGP